MTFFIQISEYLQTGNIVKDFFGGFSPVTLGELAEADAKRANHQELNRQRTMRRHGRNGTRTWGYGTTTGKRNKR
jgi:hypothetical protein